MNVQHKVIVYVPVADADQIRKAIGEAGGGIIGRYDNVSFSSRGIGRFVPLEGASSTIGNVGKLEEVEEERIEFVCKDDRLDNVIAAIRKVHPYEEPVIEVWKVELR